MYIFDLVKNRFKKRFSEEDINATLEHWMYICIKSEPIKSLSRNINSGNIAELAMDELSEEVKSIAEHFTKNAQKNKLLSVILRKKKDANIAIYLYKEAEDILIVTYAMAMLDKDSTLNNLAEKYSNTKDYKKFIEDVKLLQLQKYVYGILLESALSLAYKDLFAADIDENLIKRYGVMIKDHFMRLVVELACAGNDIETNMDNQKRKEILTKYITAVESGDFGNIDNICQKYVEITKNDI